MLPAAHRLTDAASFRTTTRRGRRASSGRLVTYLHTPVPSPDPTGTAPPASARVGFVVSKAVGNSVVRHRVQRRLRHLVRPELGALPPGSTLVVRALPPAADASSADLGTDLTRCLARFRARA